MSLIPNPTFDQLDESGSRLFMTATLLEMRLEDRKEPVAEEIAKEVNNHFLIQVLDSRIQAMKLPISFTLPAKMAILAYVDRPGGVVALLVDCLNRYEGQTVDVAKLTNLYPEGWYDEATFLRLVDDYLKPKKVKWAEIY